MNGRFSTLTSDFMLILLKSLSIYSTNQIKNVKIMTLMTTNVYKVLIMLFQVFNLSRIGYLFFIKIQFLPYMVQKYEINLFKQIKSFIYVVFIFHLKNTTFHVPGIYIFHFNTFNLFTYMTFTFHYHKYNDSCTRYIHLFRYYSFE